MLHLKFLAFSYSKLLFITTHFSTNLNIKLNFFKPPYLFLQLKIHFFLTLPNVSLFILLPLKPNVFILTPPSFPYFFYSSHLSLSNFLSSLIFSPLTLVAVLWVSVVQSWLWATVGSWILWLGWFGMGYGGFMMIEVLWVSFFVFCFFFFFMVVAGGGCGWSLWVFFSNLASCFFLVCALSFMSFLSGGDG